MVQILIEVRMGTTIHSYGRIISQVDTPNGIKGQLFANRWNGNRYVNLTKNTVFLRQRPRIMFSLDKIISSTEQIITLLTSSQNQFNALFWVFSWSTNGLLVSVNGHQNKICKGIQFSYQDCFSSSNKCGINYSDFVEEDCKFHSRYSSQLRFWR